jgi:hypothetical protein
VILYGTRMILSQLQGDPLRSRVIVYDSEVILYGNGMSLLNPRVIPCDFRVILYNSRVITSTPG